MRSVKYYLVLGFLSLFLTVQTGHLACVYPNLVGPSAYVGDAAQLLLVHDCVSLGLKFSLQYCTEMEAVIQMLVLFSILPSRWKEELGSFVKKYVATSLSEVKIHKWL